MLAASLGFIVLYGIWRGRGSDSTSKYLLAGKRMPWYAMALSIMATQGSAVTFISTTHHLPMRLVGLVLAVIFGAAMSTISGEINSLAGEAAIFTTQWLTRISFLWYNVIGCLVVVAVGVLISHLEMKPSHKQA